MKRSWSTTLPALFLLLSSAVPSFAADPYPSKPVRIVVGFPASGMSDNLARVIANALTQQMGQSFIIDNKPGAGTTIAADFVAKSPPDGYTFVLGSRADAINQTLYKKPLYDLRTDLMPVVLIADQPTVLIARPDIPAANLQELIAYTKKNQDTVKFASAGAGSTGHLDCVRFNTAIGVKITHVPYRGGGPAMQDLIAGRVDYICTLTATAVPQIESNLVKAIAVFTPNRAPMLAKLATAKEQGFGDMEASTWFGFFVPKGTPAGVIQRLRDATAEAMNTPSVQEQLLKSGALVVAPERRSTEYFRQFVESEIAKNAEPIKATGISME